VAEKIGFELVVAFCRRIALYWPTRCVFRLSAANGESITEESGRLHGAGPCRCELKVSFLSSVRIAQCHLLRIVLHVASGFLLGNSMFLDGSLGARDCDFGFLLSHEPQLATPANLAQEIWTHNERREQ
jgi:hypothetical protein